MLLSRNNSTNIDHNEIHLPGSKSILNRLLVIKSLLNEDLNMDVSREANDVQVLYKALHSQGDTLDMQDAGTPYRFMMSYCAVKGVSKVLDCYEGMKTRPIFALAKTLSENGVNIEYLEKEGFPPISISGELNTTNELTIDPSSSSQFVSSLMLVAPEISENLEIQFSNELSSRPYIEMTAQLMRAYGIKVELSEGTIQIAGKYHITNEAIEIESDWSSASYFYAWAVLLKTDIFLPGLIINSIQGDRFCTELFSHFGLESSEYNSGIKVQYKTSDISIPPIMDMNAYPDLVPTLVVLSSILKRKLKISGIDHVELKESKRLSCLQAELKKVNVDFYKNGDHWELDPTELKFEDKISFNTYNDHRLAMSFSLFASLGSVDIEKPEVVKKSFPNYWKELSKLNFDLK
jgi:3-phosphoshikimate 1-carboxyvinyltransferase